MQNTERGHVHQSRQASSTIAAVPHTLDRIRLGPYRRVDRQRGNPSCVTSRRVTHGAAAAILLFVLLHVFLLL